MPWSRTRPRNDRYGHTHAKVRAALAAQHQPTDLCGWCAKPLGPMSSNLHLAHNEQGTAYVGFWHARCNVSEAAIRANSHRGTTQLRW